MILRVYLLFNKPVLIQAGYDLRNMHAIHTGKTGDSMLARLLALSSQPATYRQDSELWLGKPQGLQADIKLTLPVQKVAPESESRAVTWPREGRTTPVLLDAFPVHTHRELARASLDVLSPCIVLGNDA